MLKLKYKWQSTIYDITICRRDILQNVISVLALGGEITGDFNFVFILFKYISAF